MHALPTLGLICAATLLAPAAAQAGRAQAGSSIGTYSTWDLDGARASGNGWRDGTVVQTVDVSGDPATANVQVHDGQHSAEVQLNAQAALRDGSAGGLPFSGHRAVRADLEAGSLALAGSTGYVQAGPTRSAWVSGYAFTELFENFDIRWAAGRVEPVVITLRLTLNGSLDGNSADNGRAQGVQAYLGLGNVVAHDPLDSLWRTETGVSGTVLTLSGSPLNSQCPAGKDYCESFLNLYAALDLRSRGLLAGDIDFSSGAPFSADFSASLALDSSPGVSLLRNDALGNPLPALAWVNASPVPEPVAALLMLAGLAGLAGVHRARWRPAQG